MLLPARLEIQGTDPVSAVTLSLLAEPESQVKSLRGPPLTTLHPFSGTFLPSPNQSPGPPAPA